MVSVLMIAGDLALAALFGAIVFFPSVVAPVVFSVMDEEMSGRFLRRFFPRYYLYLIISAVLGAAAFIASFIASGIEGSLTLAAGLALIALSTLWVRQSLMPRINAARDAVQAGDPTAQSRFNTGHRLSVVINMVQLIIVITLIGVRSI